MIHVGFTGTRIGMTGAQQVVIDDLLRKIDVAFDEVITAHHGCCVGSDEEFADRCDSLGFEVTGHPPLIKAFESRRAVELCDELREPARYEVRNKAIVDASNVMIATPREPQPQPAGGTWMTIRMALRAMLAATLHRLHVFGPDGAELDWRKW